MQAATETSGKNGRQVEIQEATIIEVVCTHSDMQPLFFMVKRHRYYRHILRAISTIDSKCDRMLCILEAMRSDTTDSILESMRESARDIYESSLAERRRVGRLFDIQRHD